MSREEAIKIFKRLKENAPNEMHIETVGSAQELFDMAIQALSQELTVQDKQAESEKYQKAFDDGYANGYAQARFDYEQEPCDDAISRDAALKEAYAIVVDGEKFDVVQVETLLGLPSVTV